MEKYSLKENSRLKIRNVAKFDAQKVGETLARLAKPDGTIVTQSIVDAAYKTKSPLHKHFEWDDMLAGNSWRKEQARSIMQSIRLLDPETDEPAPAFLSIHTDKTRYHTLSAVKSSADLQLAVLRQAEKDLAAWTTRYHELKDICEVVHGLLETMRDKIDRLAGDPDPDPEQPSV